MTTHVDWIIASVEVRQDHPAPEERSRERPMVRKAVHCAVVVKSVAVAVAVASQHCVGYSK